MSEEATEWHTGNPDDPCPYCRPHEAVDQRSPQEQFDMKPDAVSYIAFAAACMAGGLTPDETDTAWRRLQGQPPLPTSAREAHIWLQNTCTDIRQETLEAIEKQRRWVQDANYARDQQFRRGNT